MRSMAAAATRRSYVDTPLNSGLRARFGKVGGSLFARR
jgi:hypothetical protein